MITTWNKLRIGYMRNVRRPAKHADERYNEWEPPETVEAVNWISPTPFALEWPDRNALLKSSVDAPIMRLSLAGSRAGEGRWS